MMFSSILIFNGFNISQDKLCILNILQGNITEEEDPQLWDLSATPLREVGIQICVHFKTKVWIILVLLVRPGLRFLDKTLSH